MAGEGPREMLCSLNFGSPQGTFWRVRQCLGRGKEEDVWSGSRERAPAQALCSAKVSPWVLT